MGFREIIKKLFGSEEEQETSVQDRIRQHKTIVMCVAAVIVSLVLFNVLRADEPTRMIRHLTDIELKYIRTGVLEKEDAKWVVDNWTNPAAGREAVRSMIREITMMRRMAAQGIEVKADIVEIQDTLYSSDEKEASAAVIVRVEMKGSGIDFAANSRIRMTVIKTGDQWKLYEALPF